MATRRAQEETGSVPQFRRDRCGLLTASASRGHLQDLADGLEQDRRVAQRQLVLAGRLRILEQGGMQLRAAGARSCPFHHVPSGLARARQHAAVGEPGVEQRSTAPLRMHGRGEQRLVEQVLPGEAAPCPAEGSAELRVDLGVR